MRRRPPPRRKYYSPSYYANLLDPWHWYPGWLRWLLGASVVGAMAFLPLALLGFALLLLRFIWLVIQAVVGL